MDPVIRVEHLSKRYKKSPTPAVDDISFDVGAGELFAFLGPNGAGKTTTISILTTTLAKTSGTITIAGHDLDRDPTAVRREIGIIFQKPSIDSHLSGEENIRLHVALYGVYGYRPLYRLMPAEYRRRIEHLDFGMRVIRAHEIAIQLPGGVPVGCVLACACDEALVFDAIAVMRVPFVLVMLVVRIHEFPG